MKKHIMMALALGLLVGMVGLGNQTGQAKTTYRRLSRDFYKDASDSNIFRNHFYRLNKKTTVKIYYSAKSDSRTIVKKLALPKGTVISSLYQDWNSKHVVGNGDFSADLSYYLKRKTATKAVYGRGDIRFDFKLPTSRLTRVKRPAYALPLGNGTLLTGGLKAISALPTRKSNALKITSDGWLEYYQYHGYRYPDPDPDSSGKMLTIPYATKPNSAVKINKALTKGANVYLYSSKKLAGVTQKKVRTSGAYKYRLTVHNNHTPVGYEDTAYGNDYAASSIYTIGGKPFYTVVAQGGD